ncbi:MFS general substrate transporter [Apiospora saccharicola]|uniref:MFS general substrate transporter n=1 Tax=Apiospora saccharicola TaxID=335842 RepID=A0ABR1WK30_9PEZI
MRYSTSRQKACYQCSSAKAKCANNTAGSCSRCTLRGLTCIYPADASTPASRSSRRRVQRSPDGPSAQTSPPLHTVAAPDFVGGSGKEAQYNLDFGGLDLICPINVDEIATRWLHPYVPVPGQVTKDYHPRISDLIYRVPVPSQPLVNCLSIARICDTSRPGGSQIAGEILQKEMSNITERDMSDVFDIDLLATFQAYLIYTMILFFHLNQGETLSSLRQAMMSLQDLAGTASRQGLVCAADLQHARPRWESWLVTEAKRRTLYVLYLFDNVLSRQEGLPTFLGTELRGLPAPSSKSLWEAKDRREWELKYNCHLAQWPEGGLRIDELWSMPADFDEASIARRRARVDQWLVDVDEFSMMVYTVTSCTHGG